MILVTGAGGVIGRAVMARARELGLGVQGIVREPVRKLAGLNIACDLSTCSSLFDVVAQRPSAVIHLAAAVPHSPRYPDSAANAALTKSIDSCVHAAATQWQCHVVYASSCGLYDRCSDELKLETSEHHIRPESPYFEAKLDGERLFTGLPSCTVLRLPAPIGLGVPAGLVVTRFVSQALLGKTLNVWGSGRREQNFVDSADIAEATLAAARVGWRGIINIASARPVSMLELAQRVAAVVGRGSVVLSGHPDPRDLETARYSIDRAMHILRWEPRVSLDQSIRVLADSISPTL